MTILEAMQSKSLFAPWFKGESWKPWKAFLCALYGLPFEDAESFEMFKRYTGRTKAAGPFNEAYPICGRRAGKTLILALITVFCAVFKDYSSCAVPGETIVAMLLASDKRQAAIALRYVGSFFDKIPLLRQMVIGRTAESISLNNGVTILVGTSDYRAVRGFTIVCCVADELAFWPSGDSQVLDAIRPAQATIPGAVLLGASSPYGESGVLFEAWRDHWGKDDSPVLVWRAKTRAMNRTVSRALVGLAYLRDPISAAAEYGAQFRSDVAGFLDRAAVQAAVVAGRFELAPKAGLPVYAFCDASGGRRDSMTLAGAYRENNRAVLAFLREIRAPFSPEAAVQEFASVLKSYGLGEVGGDGYAAEWVVEAFRKNNIAYAGSDKNRSEIYLTFLPAIMSGQVELLDNARLVSQLVGLERRTNRGGRDTVDHGPSGADDVANAAAGALIAALGASQTLGVIDWMKAIAAGSLDSLGRHKDQPVAPAASPQPAVEIHAQAGQSHHDLGREGSSQWELDQLRHMGIRPSRPPATQVLVEIPLPAADTPCCSNPLVLTIAGGQKRCNQCGKQWWPGAKPSTNSVSRGDYLAGRIPRSRGFRG